jgi:hypothetical protein
MKFPCQGHSWPPGSPDKPVFGTLTFTRRDGANLAVADALPASGNQSEVDIIVGQTTGGAYVTLLHANQTSAPLLRLTRTFPSAIRIGKGKWNPVSAMRRRRRSKGCAFESLAEAQAYRDHWEERWANGCRSGALRARIGRCGGVGGLQGLPWEFCCWAARFTFCATGLPCRLIPGLPQRLSLTRVMSIRHYVPAAMRKSGKPTGVRAWAVPFIVRL